MNRLRRDFPILQQKVHGKPLAFLDNGASSQKPTVVIDAISDYYRHSHANIHRAVYQLSQQATDAYEGAREKARAFLGAESSKEILFVRGCTEGINLVASSFGRKYLQAGDEVLITGMEHHSNIVPWQMICQEKNAILKVVPITDEGEIEIDTFRSMLTDRTKFVSLVHVSNSLGTVNPVEEVIRLSHERDIPVLLDGAQAVPHMEVDVQALDCDFYTFSGHKIFGPTGIGILYGKEKWLDEMPPYQGGGDMIKSVTFERTTYNELPHKFEAGTPNIAGAIGLGVALEYVRNIGLDKIAAYEQELLDYATDRLLGVEGLRIIGTSKEKASLISFILEGVHPHDIGQFLDYEGIAVRTGHHCTEPVMRRFEIPATTRASFAFYNTREEVDRLAAALEKVRDIFAPK
ncbi:MAG: cysteine desulfurase [Saprospiraceae bacterium]|nr:cysteine desulfurase [Saprospiraceae bacterium]